MDCSNIDRNELAEEYLNGILDEANQSDFEIHILECQRCLQAVELLQAVRFDLSDRAPAIRTYSHVPHRGLRWPWVALWAAIVLASAVGIGKLRSRSTNTQTARNSSAPEIGAAPTYGLNMSGQRARSNTVNVNGADATDNSEKGVRSQIPTQKDQRPQFRARKEGAITPAPETSDRNATTTEVATEAGHDPSSAHELASQSPSGASTTDSAVATTGKGTVDQVAIDVSELAAVRPFPYTFAGVAGTQPSRGSVRVQHPSGSAISGAGGTGPKAGASGFRTAQDYFRDGMSAYVNRDYPTATQLLGEAAKLDPDLSEASLYLGICRLLQGNPAEAISALQPVSKAKKPALAQPAHFYLAKAYLQMGKLTDADNELHAASSLPGRLAGESSALMQRVENILNGPRN